MSAETSLLLIDSGATHTRALAVAASGGKLGEGHAGPSNAFAVGEKTALENFCRAARSALAAGRCRGRDIAGTVVGSASVDVNGAGSRPLRQILRRELALERIIVRSDAEIALEGALAGRPGVVIACGTGSVVLGKNGRGRIVKAGGWGPLIGDEGSAQWMTRQAFQAAARATDGSGSATSLVRILSRALGLDSFGQILDVVYRKPMSPAALGALAPRVAQAAAQGDACALAIFQRAGEDLADQAAAVARRLRLKRPEISPQGSVFRSGRLLLEPLGEALQRLLPGARLTPPQMPPLGGAFLLALAALRLKDTAEVRERFKEACRA